MGFFDRLTGKDRTKSSGLSALEKQANVNKLTELQVTGPYADFVRGILKETLHPAIYQHLLDEGISYSTDPEFNVPGLSGLYDSTRKHIYLTRRASIDPGVIIHETGHAVDFTIGTKWHEAITGEKLLPSNPKRKSFPTRAEWELMLDTESAADLGRGTGLSRFVAPISVHDREMVAGYREETKSLMDYRNSPEAIEVRRLSSKINPSSSWEDDAKTFEELGPVLEKATAKETEAVLKLKAITKYGATNTFESFAENFRSIHGFGEASDLVGMQLNPVSELFKRKYEGILNYLQTGQIPKMDWLGNDFNRGYIGFVGDSYEGLFCKVPQEGIFYKPVKKILEDHKRAIAERPYPSQKKIGLERIIEKEIGVTGPRAAVISAGIKKNLHPAIYDFLANQNVTISHEAYWTKPGVLAWYDPVRRHIYASDKATDSAIIHELGHAFDFILGTRINHVQTGQKVLGPKPKKERMPSQIEEWVDRIDEGTIESLGTGEGLSRYAKPISLLYPPLIEKWRKDAELLKTTALLGEELTKSASELIERKNVLRNVKNLFFAAGVFNKLIKNAEKHRHAISAYGATSALESFPEEFVAWHGMQHEGEMSKLTRPVSSEFASMMEKIIPSIEANRVPTDIEWSAESKDRQFFGIRRNMVGQPHGLYLETNTSGLIRKPTKLVIMEHAKREYSEAVDYYYSTRPGKTVKVGKYGKRIIPDRLLRGEYAYDPLDKKWRLTDRWAGNPALEIWMDKKLAPTKPPSMGGRAVKSSNADTFATVYGFNNDEDFLEHLEQEPPSFQHYLEKAEKDLHYRYTMELIQQSAKVPEPIQVPSASTMPKTKSSTYNADLWYEMKEGSKQERKTYNSALWAEMGEGKKQEQIYGSALWTEMKEGRREQQKTYNAALWDDLKEGKEQQKIYNSALWAEMREGVNKGDKAYIGTREYWHDLTDHMHEREGIWKEKGQWKADGTYISDMVKASAERDAIASRWSKKALGVGVGLSIGAIMAGRMVQSNDRNQRGRRYNSTRTIQEYGSTG